MLVRRILPWALLAALAACSGADFSQGGPGGVSEVGSGGDGVPAGTGKSGSIQGGSAMDSGTLGSQSASQDVTQNFAFDLRFPGEELEKASDIGGILFWLNFDQNQFPSGKLEKAITFPNFSHSPCCEGRLLRVLDIGVLPLVQGDGLEQETYHTFGKLIQGLYDWPTLTQARYRDYVIGAPDELGQNVAWGDLPAVEGHFMSFFLMPEGAEAVGQWVAFDSEKALTQLYYDKEIVHVRDLRVVANASKIPFHVP
ncbi:MAG: hypothetical protein K8R69_12395 [Deltaproteobacteria bacterium]|nr:hypothetical protein [Deltaproteobacteria bacterium]